MTSPRPELEAIMVAITPPQLTLSVRQPREDSRMVSRLEKLEAESRDSRFWRRWGPLIYIVIGAAIPFGLGVDSITRSLSVAQPEVSPRVEAEEFVLRDTSGLVRAKLVMDGKSPRLTFYDAEGNPRELLSVERESATTAKPETGKRRLERPVSSLADKRLASQIPLGRGILGARTAIGHPGVSAGALAGSPPGLPAGSLAAGQRLPLPAAPAARSEAPGGSGQAPTELPMPTIAANPSDVPVAAAATAPASKLVVVGYVEKPGVGREVVISDGFQVYVTHQGETFAERFKVQKITPTTVDVLDTYTNQSFQLSFSPVSVFVRWRDDRAAASPRSLDGGLPR